MTSAPISIRQVKLKEISAMRDAYRAEQDCQVVHDRVVSSALTTLALTRYR